MVDDMRLKYLLALYCAIGIVNVNASEKYIVPPVKGKTRIQAIIDVEKAGFKYILLSASNCVAKGLIGGSRPVEGTEVMGPSPVVYLVISEGGSDPESSLGVPNVIGQALVAAEATLAAKGLRAKDRTVRNEPGDWCSVATSSTLIDEVVETDPLVGVRVCKGTEVTVTRRISVTYRSQRSAGGICP